jgi:hypothetical protein
MTSGTPDTRTVVAFYGGQFTPERLEAFYLKLVPWFDALNAHPDKLGVDGEGFTGKVGAFRTSDARLRKSRFNGVKGFSLYSLKTGGEVPLWDWQVSAEIASQKSYCIIGASASNAPIPGDALLSASEFAIQAFAPTYGIGFSREMRLGPTFYATGLVQGLQPWGDEKPEGDRIGAWKWGIKNRAYEQGILRDVYPWNFLTNLQLDQRVLRVSLKQWIEQDRENGFLSPVAEGMLLWEVREAQIPRVRLVLQEAGVIFDTKTFATQ